jgi:hypothetical protein
MAVREKFHWYSWKHLKSNIPAVRRKIFQQLEEKESVAT